LGVTLLYMWQCGVDQMAAGKRGKDISQPLCPSARPDMPESTIFGVIGGSADDPHVSYLSEPLPVTQELLALSQPVKPGEVWRIAARCAGAACMHFDGSDCQLARRTVALLPPVSGDLPACRIRPRCQWWRQEGKAACSRCPAIVTESYLPSEAVREAAKPR
jgi:hypothetical protein